MNAKDFAGLVALGGYGVYLLVSGLVGAVAGIAIASLFHRRLKTKKVAAETAGWI